jgi:hypothetical protein
MGTWARPGRIAAALLLAGLAAGAVHAFGAVEQRRVAALRAEPATATYCRAVLDWRAAMRFRTEERDLPPECRAG